MVCLDTHFVLQFGVWGLATCLYDVQYEGILGDGNWKEITAFRADGWAVMTQKMRYQLGKLSTITNTISKMKAVFNLSPDGLMSLRIHTATASNSPPGIPLDSF
jgi:hypothetical protein